MDETLRRVPGPAVDDFVLETMTRLARAPITATNVKRYLKRMELHAESVHIVLDRRTLSGRHADPDSVDETLNRRLGSGERIVQGPNDEGSVRIVVPVQLKVRGGGAGCPCRMVGLRPPQRDWILSSPKAW